MAEMLRRLIGEDVALSVRLADELGDVRVDVAQLEQSIINLAVNARDAMPDGGSIYLETANVECDGDRAEMHPEVQPGAYVMLSVRDTGCGMDEITKANVFEPFFTTKDVGKGTGLGLAMVYGFVKQSGGHIAVESALGRGSTFQILLPRVTMQCRGDSEPAALANYQGTETVLLVEDDENVRSLARKILELEGYSVLEAGGGYEALRLADRYRATIHLLLTDVVMPQVNGRELAEELVRRRSGLKVLYLSGYTDDAILRHGIATDDVAFLYKPFTPGTLAQKVRAVLDQG
jgi:CheY-like chemotaxis protein